VSCSQCWYIDISPRLLSRTPQAGRGWGFRWCSWVSLSPSLSLFLSLSLLLPSCLLYSLTSHRVEGAGLGGAGGAVK